MEMTLYSSLIISGLLLLVTAQCPNDCECKMGSMTCRGLSELPIAFDSSYTDFVFDGCDFSGQLEKMPMQYNNAHHLEIIHSHVTSIAIGAFDDLNNLAMLGLRGNKIDMIDSAALHNLPNLKYIDLQGNKIREIEDELFKFNPKMEKVNFNDNPIWVINKRAFAQPKDAEDPKNPENMSKIKYIELENCNLTTVPTAALCMHSKVPHLVSLDLSRNNFTELDEFLFKHTDGLQQLELDSCSLKKISRETLGGLTKLTNLRLSNNNISTIDDQAFDDFFGTMEYIHLEYNNLKVIPYELFNWATIQVLNISHNPWECSCTNGWMQDYNVQPNDTRHNVTWVQYI